ncbi:prolyl oligopeptidase family serine peptidase [Stenotrophomonas sp. HITSZ_GD]|uniref:S9 family peptidase n=1 Tax=Stenotrophomonas sp. HITSZ_GD TaxID=3037248 RepID=UPI00240D9906|nr:prolyl oligopeptidase family serine peptidase [Stenotrophomonas sp. HITSZ_GD]MDG2525746.1 prolyl oligopeptidase family serine peptidase [Stenotrophomonas sp. HITSZ_GD]
MQAGWKTMWTGVLAGCLLAPAAWSATPAAPPATQAAAPGYRLPPAPLQAVADAPNPPRLVLSRQREYAALLQSPALPGIAQVAQPELKLAGLRLHPRTRSRSEFSFAQQLWLMHVADGQQTQIDGLPAPLSLASVSWSPDQRYLAFNRVDSASGANELWLVDVGAHRAWRVAERLNTLTQPGYRWMPDSRSLLVLLQPAGQGAAPADDGIPAGPAIQQTAQAAGARSIRTYQDLLRNEGDARRLEYYLAAQPARVALNGQIEPLGAPGLYTDLAPSPDGQHLLSQRIERPFSYLVPLTRFPRRIEVLDARGRYEHEVARLPLVEGLPTGNDAVPTGVRAVQWRADAPATLLWAEAQDGGDPSREARIRDAVMVQAAPFEQPPQTLIELATRFADVTWGRGDLALVDEYWWKDRKIRQWRVAPDAPGQAPVLLNERSEEDRYADPGTPATVDDENGQPRLFTDAQGQFLYLVGEGASPEGDRPFVDRLDLRDGQRERLFQSQAPFYERPRAPLDAQGRQWLTTRESPDEPANWYVRTLGAADAPRALTRFAHPLPQLRGVQKEQIRYKRADGVDLTATLLLPPGYEAKRDGPLPMLMWAYPGEFKSAAAASQVTDSPYRFNAVGYWGPQAYLAMGYAVLNNPSMPIIGEGDAEPNDTYVQQLVADAQAAVDEVVRRGVADRERIAIGGHSYGAFMTANLLAHSTLFKAGIARSGAYNRTLTPFGFQSEERNYWQAQPVYAAMSPFNYADRIKTPLLLIHGQDDDNSGTFPIQSERLYAAVKGLGGTARLVMLPNEAHRYRARESIMQMLAETNDWLQQYLGSPSKAGASAKGKGTAASP